MLQQYNAVGRDVFRHASGDEGNTRQMDAAWEFGFESERGETDARHDQLAHVLPLYLFCFLAVFEYAGNCCNFSLRKRRKYAHWSLIMDVEY